MAQEKRLNLTYYHSNDYLPIQYSSIFFNTKFRLSISPITEIIAHFLESWCFAGLERLIQIQSIAPNTGGPMSARSVGIVAIYPRLQLAEKRQPRGYTSPFGIWASALGADESTEGTEGDMRDYSEQ